MRPYIKAMTWAFWRERRFHLALFILMASVFSLLMRQFNPIFEKYGATQVIIIFAVFIELFSISMLMISGLTSHVMPLTITDQLYVKPVSSKFLAAIHLGLSVLSIILIHLAAVLLYRFVGHLNWPFIMPVIFLTMIILCIYAVLWSLSDVPFLCLMSIFIICAFSAFFGMESMFKKQVSLHYFILYIMPYFLIIDIFALVVCFKAIKNVRCGEKLRSGNFWEHLYLRLKDLLPGKNWNLNTPKKAYFWLLFRSSGLIIPDWNLFFILIAILVFIFEPEPDKSMVVKKCMITFAAINIFVVPFFGALIAHQEDKSYGVSYQIATRPISERSILATILKVFITSYIIGWVIYCIGLAIILTLLVTTGHLDLSEISISKFQQMIRLSYLPKILLFPLGIWAAAGLFGSILASGRKWLLLGFFTAIFVLSIIFVFVNTLVSEHFYRILKSLLVWLFAFGSISGTIIAMIYAIRRYLISSRFILILIGVYVSFCIIGLILNFSVVNNPANAVILCGMLALPFAPFATAPLALHWNRHR